MREKEFKPIIDRDKHEKDAIKYLSKHLEFLTDIVNYGSNLIPRAYDSSDKKLEDIIVIAVLLKQIILMIDAAEVLISQGAVTAAYLQARATFEASLYIEWILKSDSEKKARYYYISNLRRQRLWALRFDDSTIESQAFIEALEPVKEHIDTKDLGNLQRQAEEEVTGIDALLLKPGWKEISEEYEKVKNKSIGAERDWYRLLGVSSIRQLAKRVGRLGMYELYYSRSSEVIHGTAYKDHIRLGKGKITFEPVRQLKDANLVLRFINITAIDTFKSVLTHYRYGELTNFARKYTLDWRNAFLNVPSISYSIEGGK